MLPTPFAERVLDLVALVPPGRAVTYGDVAALLGEGGPRAVGTVMARFGSGVPWHRVVRADGSPALGHEVQALRRFAAERTPMVDGGTRVDLRRARWAGPQGEGPPREGPRTSVPRDSASPSARPR